MGEPRAYLPHPTPTRIVRHSLLARSMDTSPAFKPARKLLAQSTSRPQRALETHLHRGLAWRFPEGQAPEPTPFALLQGLDRAVVLLRVEGRNGGINLSRRHQASCFQVHRRRAHRIDGRWVLPGTVPEMVPGTVPGKGGPELYPAEAHQKCRPVGYWLQKLRRNM